MSKFPVHIESGESSCSIQSAVPLELVKQHLRVQHDLENEYIQVLIANAFDIAQEFTGSKFLKTISYFLAPKLYSSFIIHDDVFSLESIRYKDINGVDQFLDLDDVTLEYVDESKSVLTINPIPLFTEEIDSVRVMYQTNTRNLTGCELPGAILQAILLMVGEFYEYREDRVWNLPKASERLLNPYINWGF